MVQQTRPETAAGEQPRVDGDHIPPSEAARHLGLLIREIREYFSYFLSARVDGVKMRFRRAGVYAALGIVGLFVVAVTLSMSVVLFMLGAALGLGLLFGMGSWLGELVLGFFVLLAAGIGVALGLRSLRRSFLRKTVRKYEHRKSWQTHHFGRNVQDAAAARRE